MSRSHPSKRANSGSTLVVRLDDESKSILAQAAQARRVSISDYVRSITLAQARRDVESAEQQGIGMSPDEQLAFWSALDRPIKLTTAQRRLGKLMRGER